MQPLQDLLHRVKWDPGFGRGDFAIGYEDRIARREVVVSFTSVELTAGRPETFSVRKEDGSVVHIPLHRVRTVYKNGKAIWQRSVAPSRG